MFRANSWWIFAALLVASAQLAHGAEHQDHGGTWLSPKAINPWWRFDSRVDEDVVAALSDGNNTALVLASFAPRRGSVYSLYRTTDRGRTWESVNQFGEVWNNHDDFAAIATNKSGAWIILTVESIYRSTDNGVTWTRQSGFAVDEGNTFYDADVSMTASGTVMCAYTQINKHLPVRAKTRIAISPDFGVSWSVRDFYLHERERRERLEGDHSLSVATNGAGVWLVADTSLLGVSSDGGATWNFTETDIPYNEWLRGGRPWLAYLPNGSFLYSVAQNGLRVSSDQGQTWSGYLAPSNAASFQYPILQIEAPLAEPVQVVTPSGIYSILEGPTWTKRSYDIPIVNAQYIPFPGRAVAFGSAVVDGYGPDSDFVLSVWSNDAKGWTDPSLFLPATAVDDGGSGDWLPIFHVCEDDSIIVVWSSTYNLEARWGSDSDLFVMKCDSTLSPMWPEPLSLKPTAENDVLRDRPWRLVEGSDGSIVLLAYEYPNERSDIPADVYAYVSSDTGDTWSAPQHVAAAPRSSSESALGSILQFSNGTWTTIPGVFDVADGGAGQQAAIQWNLHSIIDVFEVSGEVNYGLGPFDFAWDAEGNFACLRQRYEDPRTNRIVTSYEVAYTENGSGEWSRRELVLPDGVAPTEVREFKIVSDGPEQWWVFILASVLGDDRMERSRIYFAKCDSPSLDSPLYRVLTGTELDLNGSTLNLVPHALDVAISGNHLVVRLESSIESQYWPDFGLPSVFEPYQRVMWSNDAGETWVDIRDYDDFINSSHRLIGLNAHGQVYEIGIPTPPGIVGGGRAAGYGDDLDVFARRFVVPTGVKGDVNFSHSADIVDVQLIINGLLGLHDDDWQHLDADGNGYFDAADLQSLINIVLGR